MGPIKTVLATNEKELDKYLKSLGELEVVKEVFYREGLVDAARRSGARLAIVSAYLPGQSDLAEILFRLRMMDLRVIFLAGDIPGSDPLIGDLIAMGIYDILFNPIYRERILEHLNTPATLADAMKTVGNIPRPSGKRLLGFLNLRNKALEEALGMSLELVEEPKREGPVKLPQFLPSKLKREKRIEMNNGKQADSKNVARETDWELGEKIPERNSQETVSKKEEVAAKFLPGRPVIAVWSPVAAGKTFVATNLARAMSENGNVCLLDLDPKRAIFNWLALLAEEDAVNQIFRGSLLETVPLGVKVKGVTVYSSDPKLPCEKVDLEKLNRFTASAQIEADAIIVDLPSVLPPWGKEIIRGSSLLIVGDPDFAHGEEVRRAVTRYPQALTVLNRYIEVEDYSAEDMTGKKPLVVIPEIAGVYQAILLGEFVFERSEEARRAFRELAEIFWKGGLRSANIGSGLPDEDSLSAGS